LFLIRYKTLLSRHCYDMVANVLKFKNGFVHEERVCHPYHALYALQVQQLEL